MEAYRGSRGFWRQCWLWWNVSGNSRNSFTRSPFQDPSTSSINRCVNCYTANRMFNANTGKAEEGHALKSSGRVGKILWRVWDKAYYANVSSVSWQPLCAHRQQKPFMELQTVWRGTIRAHARNAKPWQFQSYERCKLQIHRRDEQRERETKWMGAAAEQCDCKVAAEREETQSVWWITSFIYLWWELSWCRGLNACSDVIFYSDIPKLLLH